jgi:hypothetical protein
LISNYILTCRNKYKIENNIMWKRKKQWAKAEAETKRARRMGYILSIHCIKHYYTTLYLQRDNEQGAKNPKLK